MHRSCSRRELIGRLCASSMAGVLLCILTSCACQRSVRYIDGFAPNDFVGGWPSGLHGDLVVGDGEVVQLKTGFVYDFSNVTVEKGGVIESLPGPGWVILGVAGRLSNKGIIRATRGTEDSPSGGFVVNAPDGYSAAYEVTWGKGGRGGRGSTRDGPSQSYGGSQGIGNGGGGGASFTGQGRNANGAPGTPIGGGKGATPVKQPGDVIGPGGRGAIAYGGPGGPGGNATRAPKGRTNRGGGGGGGHRGFHGQGILLRVVGDTILVGGEVSVRGQQGGAGGDGGDTRKKGAGYSASPGGAGGGGAGGAGGLIIIRFSGAYAPGVYSFDGGEGGCGGEGGEVRETPIYDAEDGQEAERGSTGACKVDPVS